MVFQWPTPNWKTEYNEQSPPTGIKDSSYFPPLQVTKYEHNDLCLDQYTYILEYTEITEVPTSEAKPSWNSLQTNAKINFCNLCA